MTRPAEGVLKGIKNRFVFAEEAKGHGINDAAMSFCADEEGAQKKRKRN